MESTLFCRSGQRSAGLGFVPRKCPQKPNNTRVPQLDSDPVSISTSESRISQSCPDTVDRQHSSPAQACEQSQRIPHCRSAHVSFCQSPSMIPIGGTHQQSTQIARGVHRTLQWPHTSSAKIAHTRCKCRNCLPENCPKKQACNQTHPLHAQIILKVKNTFDSQKCSSKSTGFPNGGLDARKRNN